VSPAAPGPSAVIPVPRTTPRAGLGVGVVLLALHSLTAGIPATIKRPAVTPEQVRLRLDPNVASREELMLLPRIGPAIADSIIEYRESMPPRRAFRRPEDLENVHSIGPLTVAQLRPFLCFPSARADDANAEVVLP